MHTRSVACMKAEDKGMAHSHEQHAVFVFARCSIHTFGDVLLQRSKQKEMRVTRALALKPTTVR